VLLLHGVTGGGHRWRRVAEEALPARRAIAPDLRGHGRSTWSAPWDAATLVDDLLETLDALGVARTAVVGHSYGGLVATRLTSTVPGRVTKLALIDPAVALPPDLCTAEAEVIRRDEGWASLEEARADRLARRPEHARDTVDDDLEAHLDRAADGRLRLRFSRPAVITAWSEMAKPPLSLAGYGGRGLLVPALHDEYVTPAYRAALIRDLGPRLEERGVEAGHMLYWDAFEALAGLLAAFLAA
jgi:lipase